MPDAVVGAGTITKAQDFTAASDARAGFDIGGSATFEQVHHDVD